MKPRVFITRQIPENGIKMIERYYEIDLWKDQREPPKDVLLEKITDVDAIVTLVTDKVDKELLDNASKLRIITQYAVGYDNIDLEEATKRGIYVTNTPGVLTDATADLAFALLLTSARRVVEADQFVRSGEWKRSAVGWHPLMFLGYGLKGKTLGIIGFGRIGQAVARRAKGFGMKIIYYSRRRKLKAEKEIGAEYVDFETLLEESDFISLHVPFTDETHHMIGEKELKIMKPTAILINTARGPVVDTKALIKALQEGWIAGAGLDVFEEEPYYNEELFKLKNVVLAPHLGSATHEAREGMAELVAKNLIAFAKGEIPPNLVNKDVINIKKPGFE
ncbi:D-glycerate dehydrogenase [Thermococcus argininiproducens]|uniref:D-glycerate dehydrogenase n=1 Tax=Thermococcus argininiproducens TaxID=2866384 RepID=A0A9E7M960_9EURY|nr:glyoxylate reductase [Thermococcus argininiproducens]USG99716.1 D-glycerate dehydrogenase [Thermococcus argininiproducens]